MEIHHPQGRTDAMLAVVLRFTLRTLLKPVFSPRRPIGTQRWWLRQLSRTSLPARGVRIEAGTLDGVPGEWLCHGERRAERGHVLYFHGGAYCVGSPATHRSLTTRLASGIGVPVFAAAYRLAPEHRFPSALDDAMAAYLALRARGPVIVGGDSAGAGLALSLALALRTAALPPPTALMLLSPLADAVPASFPEPHPGEALLSAEWVSACGAHYLGPQPDAKAWMASALMADLHHLPPVLIQGGTDDLLYPQALALHAALQAAGVDCQCDITQGRWHVFQLHGGALPSADQAIARLSSFARRHLP